MRSLGLVCIALLTLVAGMSGCAGIPGATGGEQAETIDALVERTLADLYKQEPKAREAVANSVGYVVMNNKITKIPVVGAGSGYGVAIKIIGDLEIKGFFVLPRGSASQALGDEGDDQGIQAHPLLSGLCCELGMEAFWDPLDPLPAHPRRRGRDRVFELLRSGEPGTERIRGVVHRFLDRLSIGDASGEVGELHQPPAPFGLRQTADREGILNLFHA